MAGIAKLVENWRNRSKKIALIIEPPGRKRPYMIAEAYFDRIRKDDRLWK